MGESNLVYSGTSQFVKEGIWTTTKCKTCDMDAISQNLHLLKAKSFLKLLCAPVKK
jgi:hypothetical protein